MGRANLVKSASRTSRRQGPHGTPGGFRLPHPNIVIASLHKKTLIRQVTDNDICSIARFIHRRPDYSPRMLSFVIGIIDDLPCDMQSSLSPMQKARYALQAWTSLTRGTWRKGSV